MQRGLPRPAKRQSCSSDRPSSPRGLRLPEDYVAEDAEGWHRTHGPEHRYEPEHLRHHEHEFGKSATANLALGRAAFSRYCGECHDHRLPTAKPKALAIFDLADARWIEKLSPRQVEAAKGRLKGKATDAEKVATAAILDGRGQ